MDSITCKVQQLNSDASAIKGSQICCTIKHMKHDILVQSPKLFVLSVCVQCEDNNCEVRYHLLMCPSSSAWSLSDSLRMCNVCILRMFCVSMWNLRCLAGSLPMGQSYDEQLSTRATLQANLTYLCGQQHCLLFLFTAYYCIFNLEQTPARSLIFSLFHFLSISSFFAIPLPLSLPA